MNAGIQNAIRYWLSILFIAAVMATAATSVALNLTESDDTAAHHMWYAGYGSGGSNGGG